MDFLRPYQRWEQETGGGLLLPMENRRPILGGGDGPRISNTGTGFFHVRRILEISQEIIDVGQKWGESR